ncbi:hypothetical protein RHSIM_Rhsim10G0108700 [Rhododendron simsii]|uniref:Isopenicillin N synthase-like Fe(2+) 2OG dioxygenase domain-containing protein n=1 Tax=Rhododendron simsii TaxID=118357 RepID=A0A834GG03_RHOSS|nr:hypothetical protein RHSIM_Rhsim10G0108700 [Rhododendron simsii]
MQGRFTIYPIFTKPDQVFGVKPHSDGSGVTVLLQDKEVQSLQVLKEDRWLTVPVIPLALFVNLGDQMQVFELEEKINIFSHFDEDGDYNGAAGT